MEGTYDVYLGTEAVGKVTVTREGLYYRFVCSCHLWGDVCKLKVTCDDTEAVLGTLVPMGAAFGIRTRVPVKRLGEGKMHFSVLPQKTVVTGKFVPICPEEPFAYLERLKDAYLEKRNGCLGVIIQESSKI